MKIPNQLLEYKHKINSSTNELSNLVNRMNYLEGQLKVISKIDSILSPGAMSLDNFDAKRFLTIGISEEIKNIRKLIDKKADDIIYLRAQPFCSLDFNE